MDRNVIQARLIAEFRDAYCRDEAEREHANVTTPEDQEAAGHEVLALADDVNAMTGWLDRTDWMAEVDNLLLATLVNGTVDDSWESLDTLRRNMRAAFAADVRCQWVAVEFACRRSQADADEYAAEAEADSRAARVERWAA